MIVILGGGISGLATAWYLKQKTSQKIVLIEKAPRLGGWIRSTCEKGFFFEHGPRSLRPHGGEETLRLIRKLGLEDQIVLGEKAAHERFLYFNDSLHKLPRSFGDFLRSPWMWSVVPPLLMEWSRSTGEKEDESIYDFISRRLSPRIASRFLDPMTKGIFAGDIHTLSMKSCFPKIYRLEQEAGSITRGMLSKKKSEDDDPFISQVKKASLYTLQEGLESLVKKLACSLDIEVHLSTPVTKIDFQSGLTVHTPHQSFDAKHVISTLPAHALAPLLPRSLSESLQTIPTKSLSVAHVGFHHRVLQRQGFGYLIPSSEREEVLGIVWDSSAFPSQNQSPDQTRMTVMMDSGDEKTVFSALRRHLGISKIPDFLNIFEMNQAIPQYTVGHSQRLATIQDNLPMNFYMTGNSFEGISVNDCILQAQKLAETKF